MSGFTLVALLVVTTVSVLQVRACCSSCDNTCCSTRCCDSCQIRCTTTTNTSCADACKIDCCKDDCPTTSSPSRITTASTTSTEWTTSTELTTSTTGKTPTPTRIRLGGGSGHKFVKVNSKTSNVLNNDNKIFVKVGINSNVKNTVNNKYKGGTGATVSGSRCNPQTYASEPICGSRPCDIPQLPCSQSASLCSQPSCV